MAEVNELKRDPRSLEVINRSENRNQKIFEIKNASFEDLQADDLAVSLNRQPQEVIFKAIQGFTEGKGAVGFHTEPATVTEMYFPLTGRVQAYRGIPSNDGMGAIEFTEHTLNGALTSAEIERAKLILINTVGAPQLRVTVDGKETIIEPFVITAQTYHGTIGVFEDQMSPSFVALKMKPKTNGQK